MFKKGDVVRIKLEWCESTKEGEQDYVVLDAWDNKVEIVTKLDSMVFPLVNIVADKMLNLIGHVDL